MSNNKQRKGKIFLNFTKGETFHSYANQVLFVLISLLSLSKRGLPVPFTLQKQPTRGVHRKKMSPIIVYDDCSPVNLLHIYETHFCNNISSGMFLALTKKRTYLDTQLK